MKFMIKELIEYRHLLWMLTWRDIRIRYKQTVMGFAWVLFMPLLYVGAGLVIGRFAKIDSGRMPYPLFVMIGVLPWSFFVASLKFSTNSLVANLNLVTKIYFPREVLPLSSIGACFLDFLVASLFIAVALGFYMVRGEASITPWALFVPIVMLSQILMTVGLGLLLAMANLLYRDIKYIVDGVLTVGVFVTAVYYPLGGLFMLNPMTPILNAYRDLLVYGHAPDWMALSYVFTFGLIIFLVGWVSFHKGEFWFAENI